MRAKKLIPSIFNRAELFEITAGIFDFWKNKDEEDAKEDAKKIAPKNQVNAPQQKQVQAPPIQQVVPQKPQSPKPPIKIDIPEGRVDTLYRNIPALNKITPDQIRVTINAASHIDKLFRARLQDLNADIHTVGVNIENNIVRALRQAIVNGILIRNFPVDDPSSKDRLLEFSININLANVHDKLEGMAYLKVYCRLSASNGSLTVRNIDKNFKIEVENEYDERDADMGEYENDQQEYPEYE